jgi:hypothetical protein
MAICRFIETGATPDQYEQIRAKLGVGETPPPGAALHIAAKTDDGKIRIVEVWDSKEQAEAFGEKVRAARVEAGFGTDTPPPIEYLELHTLVQA